ncbi:endonuclease III domain-containing protein [Aquifex aeolicus]|uniref:Endonuclease III n=1 Tax=Aquifex aeolicus (strain VF5) TaxID=224324 RepID=O66636_AQUAE|nr:endonuclease III [Aquifex aeolicus]AAC06594.1 endonuclease III [Aquifex aeolicus VF5]
MKREDVPKVLEILKREFPKWNAPVVHMIAQHDKDPFRVLVCALLSTRTKDELTWRVCKRFFEKVKSPEDLIKLSEKEIEELIYPVGFYRVKAKQLKEIGKILIEKYGGKVPDTLEELLKLPGVGRKVANLVLSKGFNKPAIVVDVHVHRIVNRWCLVKTKTPEETERKLMEIVPKELWSDINYLLVAFGQTICLPRKPKCEECPVEKYCGKCL